jgi:methylenetetrahydrofolate dehydrogenase (NADP+)/methenyltetrahydrofolate cyclohydrolase
VTAERLDGKKTAQAVRARVDEAVNELEAEHGVTPRLDAILAGDDPASQVYVEKKKEDCEEVGIDSRLHDFDADVDEGTLLDTVEGINEADRCDGALVQLPLPNGLDEARVLEAVAPAKDVDGFHPVNLGRLVDDRAGLTPATPTGILHLLSEYGIDLDGAHAVVVGRSTIVGKPMAALLLQRGVDATVTVCHSRTQNLDEVARRADVLVAAAGRPELVTADMVGEGATVVDVGINRVDGELVGDVAFEQVQTQAGHITPVPGGVGPLTRAFLLVNVVRAMCLRRGFDLPDPMRGLGPNPHT